MVAWEIGARMDQRPIVPHDEIALPPLVLIDELAAFANFVELGENLVAFGVRETLQPRRQQAVHEKRLFFPV